MDIRYIEHDPEWVKNLSEEYDNVKAFGFSRHYENGSDLKLLRNRLEELYSSD